MSSRKTSRGERSRNRRRRRLHAKGVLAFLGGLGGVVVPAVLLALLPRTVADARAAGIGPTLHHAPGAP
ncbi:hypothetical protein [Streptomyces sp. NBC_01264]|uniref:hypothetical protein n=1 Tax=Streptomyces sp. NBC_01264 TaxID=2903804 RepID=UPI0022574C5D|nr:hypothetical protein [Streptomyces sp. NBC_01264]MCX4776929.1 hypothetical protein [Streptomyces sp. NBC_01264]